MSALTSSLTGLVGVALKRAPGLKGDAVLPALEARRSIPITSAWVQAYRRQVGAVDDGVLPLCAPQVLAVALHLEILRQPAFTLPAMGMVHVRNTFDQRRALPASGVLDLRVRLSGTRHLERGIEFDLTNEVFVDGDVAWSSVMTALVRKKASSSSSSSSSNAPAVEAPGACLCSSTIRVAENTGRRYASVAGDANPIHLTAATAKLLGFKRAIAHGMWTLQRSLEEVRPVLPTGPEGAMVGEVRFIRPVFLPSTVVVTARSSSSVGGVDVEVDPLRPGPPHLRASFRRPG